MNQSCIMEPVTACHSLLLSLMKEFVKYLEDFDSIEYAVFYAEEYGTGKEDELRMSLNDCWQNSLVKVGLVVEKLKNQAPHDFTDNLTPKCETQVVSVVESFVEEQSRFRKRLVTSLIDSLKHSVEGDRYEREQAATEIQRSVFQLHSFLASARQSQSQMPSSNDAIESPDDAAVELAAV